MERVKKFPSWLVGRPQAQPNCPSVGASMQYNLRMSLLSGRRRALTIYRHRAIRVGFLFMFACSAWAQRKALGDVSFPVPNGYQYEFTPGEDHATIGFKNGSAYCVLVIYNATRSLGDPETNFKAAWRRLLGKVAPGIPTPIYDLQPQTGNPGRQSGYPSKNGQQNFWLFTLESGRDFIPVVVLTSGRQMFDTQMSAIMQFVKDVRQGPLKPPPPPANHSASKTSITLADMAGEWNYKGERYTIAAGGRYEYGMTAYSGNHIVREKNAGVLEMGGEFLVFRDMPGPHLRRYHFISYQAAADGSAVLTLLAEQHPVNASNITLYAQQWIRAQAR